MNKNLLLVISTILIFSIILITLNFTISNFMDDEEKEVPLEFIKNIRMGYPESGIYKRKLQKARELGIEYLDKMEALKFGNFKNPAVMFDIDETLSFYGVPLIEIVDIAKHAQSKGLLIVIITARPTSSLEFSKKELKDLGIQYDYMFHLSDNDNIQTYKQGVKAKLKEQGDVNIIMSIGDNIIDVAGNHSGYSIKLPNVSSGDDNLYHLNKDSKLVKVM